MQKTKKEENEETDNFKLTTTEKYAGVLFILFLVGIILLQMHRKNFKNDIDQSIDYIAFIPPSKYFDSIDVKIKTLKDTLSYSEYLLNGKKSNFDSIIIVSWKDSSIVEKNALPFLRCNNETTFKSRIYTNK